MAAHQYSKTFFFTSGCKDQPFGVPYKWDPQNPPAGFGTLLAVDLVPSNPTHPKVTVVMPQNAKPVLNCLMMKSTADPPNTPGKRTAYQAGWNINGFRVFLRIHPDTNAVELMFDQDG